jgi:hypothetical protein
MPELPPEAELWYILIFFLVLAYSIFVIYVKKTPEDEDEEIVVSSNTNNSLLRRRKGIPYQDRTLSQSSIPQPGKTILPHNVWMKLAQEQFDQAPHTLIIGSTGSGKTWLAQALATTREGYVVILDPKWKPHKWGGSPAITVDDDLSYKTLELSCQSLLSELKKRQVALKHGQETFQSLTVVVEELPTLLDECPTAPMLFKRLGQLGRELRIRVLGLSQSDRVKTLKLEGEGDARSNYLFIRLGEHAISVCPAAAELARPASIEWQKNNYPIDVTRIPDLIEQHIPRERWWIIETPQPSQIKETPDHQTRSWSVEHVKVASWLTSEPDISIREIARRLYPGSDGSGSYSIQAKTLIEEVKPIINVTRDLWESHDKTANGNGTPTPDRDGIPFSDEVYQDTNEVYQDTNTITDDDIRRLHFREGWSKTKITTLLKGSKQERLARITTALNVKVS